MTKDFVSFLITKDALQKLSLMQTFIDRLNILFSQISSSLVLGNKLLGIIVTLFVAITILFLYRKTKDINKQFIKTSVIVIFTFLLILTFFHHDIFDHYLVGLPVFYILLFSLSVNLIYQRTKNYILPGIIVAIIFFINLNPIAVLNNFSKPLWIGDASVYRNKLQVIDYVYRQSKGKPFKYVVYTRAVYNSVYQYLFMWYGQGKYHYAPSQDTHLAYFILEQDPQYPYDLNDWLRVREKDGKIIKTEEFKSGIVVQTRVH